jgi:hypothetical protein
VPSLFSSVGNLRNPDKTAGSPGILRVGPGRVVDVGRSEKDARGRQLGLDRTRREVVGIDLQTQLQRNGGYRTVLIHHLDRVGDLRDARRTERSGTVFHDPAEGAPEEFDLTPSLGRGSGTQPERPILLEAQGAK